MKKIDLTRTLIETTVRRTLEKIQEAPEREIRNLVDFGLEFSNGRFQKKFLTAARKMLINEESAYYTLIKDIVSNVDSERLMTFGINVGYEGCTKGAKTIREIEATRHCNIPWFLSLSINEKKLEEDPDFYPAVLKQGVSLGIHTYLLSIAGDPAKIIPLLKSQPGCAFVLYLHGAQITKSFLTEFHAVRNVMISIYADEKMPEACKKLRDSHYLYAVYTHYTEWDAQHILQGRWLEEVLPAQPTFGFIIPEPSCRKELQQEIYSYILSIRDGQKYPIILMDVRQDGLMVDGVISSEACIVGFDENGNMRTQDGIYTNDSLNLFTHKLKDILECHTEK